MTEVQPEARPGAQQPGAQPEAQQSEAQPEVRRSVVLLSGGLDSATVLALAREEGLRCHALTVRYGQRHAREIECARLLATALGAEEHRVLDVDLRAFGGSALLGDSDVPEAADRPGSTSIPITYVPARNTVFLALGLACAEALDAEAVYLGVNAVDFSGYPDCRPEFVEAFAEAARLGTRRGIEGRPIAIRVPLIAWSKGRIIAEGRRLGVDFSLTSSCYDPREDGSPCERCESCRIRSLGFGEAGVPDPGRRVT